MAMASLISLIFFYIAIVFVALFFLVSPSYCVNLKQPPDTFRSLGVAAEKTRLGSMPPSCHNKCNQCHPCMAVEVPTLPSHNRFQMSLDGRVEEHLDSSPSSPSNRYSNYKPLGWKCRCGGHFYNP